MSKIPFKPSLSIFLAFSVFFAPLAAQAIVTGATVNASSSVSAATSPLTISPRPACIRLDNNLKFQARNDDVKNLQDFLRMEGVFTNSSTGYFGSLTLAAVKKFQAKNNISATGFVGPLTRAKIHVLQGCNTNDAVRIINVTGSSSLKVNAQGSWTVQAINSAGGTLRYGVSWGDTVLTTNHNDSASVQQPIYVQTNTFTYAYDQAGTYIITFYIVNENYSKTDQKTFTVTVSDYAQPKITVLSPDGGEKWNTGSVQTIRWSVLNNTNPNAKVDLYLDYDYPIYNCTNQPCPMTAQQQAMPYRMPIVLDKNIAWNAEYNWIVGTDIINNPIPQGQYKVRICAAGSETNCDASDAAFTLIDPAYENNKPPVFNGISNPTILKVNEAGTWTISAYDPEGDALTYQASWIKSGSQNLQGIWPSSNTNSFTTSFASVGEYTLKFLISDKIGKSTEVKATVNVQN